MSTAITLVRPRHFRVDFAKLRRENQSFFQRLLGPRGPVDIDPFLISEAVRSVLRRCEAKNPSGQRIVWNEFRVFLSSTDHQGMQPLVKDLEEGLEPVIRETLVELGATMRGDPMIRILIDEEQEITQGIGAISASFKENQKLAPPAPGEEGFTVRLRGLGRRPPAPPTPPAPTPVPAAAGPKAICVSWDSHEVSIAVGSRIVVGRLHPGAPADFIPLHGASGRITRLHLKIANGKDGVVTLTRPQEANPVTIGGQPLRRGQSQIVDSLPISIELSNGDLLLRLKPCH